MKPSFAFHLHQSIGKVTIDDGKFPCLTCATTGGKVLIHSPHKNNSVQYLNINRNITSLLAVYHPIFKRDILIIGTDNHILAYDVELNSDIFNREVSDGVITTTFNQDLIFVGGNCAIQGFDLQGNEQYWTTTGGNVNSLLSIPHSNDLIVGSDDYTIYLYQNESVVSELSQTDSIIALTWLQENEYFAYATHNNSLGVYHLKELKRVWKTKTKDSVTCLQSYDINGDSIKELIIGYENGNIEVRTSQNGQLLYQIESDSSIATILVSDYRSDGQSMLLCCHCNGQVQGYLQASPQVEESEESQLLDVKLEQLQEQRNHLVMELKYNNNNNNSKSSKNQVTSVLKPNHSHSCVELQFHSTDVIKLAIVNTTLEESQLIYNNENQTTITIPLKPEKNLSFDIIVQLLSSSSSSSVHQCMVTEYVYKIPPFCMYEPISTNKNIASHVTFEMKQSMEQVIEWLNTSFNIVYNNSATTTSRLQIDMVCIRDESLLHIEYDLKSGIFVIKVDSMEVAGDLIQDLCQYMNIQELKLNTCQFPLEMKQLTLLLEKMEQLQETRHLLSTEMADATLYIKESIVNAENARLMNNMKELKQSYEQLRSVNMELIHEHTKRSKNHEELLDSLKQVNQIITKASRLRMGNAKNALVSETRQAMKNRNWNQLVQLLQNEK